MQQVHFGVNATISISKLDQSFWYMACNKCNRSTGVEYNETFKCIFCKEERVVAEPRYSLNMFFFFN